MSLLLGYLVCAASVFTAQPTAPRIRILFDDLHGQSFGNADWTPDHAYSDFADDLSQYLNASVFTSASCGCSAVSPELLRNMDCLIIPEPNIRFQQDEIRAIRNFVDSGGALFVIGDHGGSDRNFDGWDSSLILNELLSDWGILFLGNTFSETPLRGSLKPDDSRCNSILDGVRKVGAWAATSLIIEPGMRNWTSLLNSERTGYPFMVCGSVGQGRVAAIGDSSSFDDGSGDHTKNRHSAYNSWLFDQQRLGIQTIAWLTGSARPNLESRKYPFPVLGTQNSPDPGTTRIIIDASHGNNDAGIMDRFGEDCLRGLSIPVCLNLTNYNDLDARDILILANPDISLSGDDINTLTSWVRTSGGRLVVCGISARNPTANQLTLNRLLEGLDADIRLESDQIVDPDNNTGTPWSLLIRHFPAGTIFSEIDSAVFWSSASLVDPSGKPLTGSDTLRILASASISARSTGQRPSSGSDKAEDVAIESTEIGPPVAAVQWIDNGMVVVLGANPFTNFQYPLESEKLQMERIKWDHRTARFNLALIRFLETSTVLKVES